MAVLGAPTTRDHIPAAIEANLRRAYLPKMGQPMVYQWLYNVENLDQKTARSAVYHGLGTFPTKAEGGALTFDSGGEAWTTLRTAIGFGLGIQVTREAIKDDLHGVVKAITRQGQVLADVARYTKERDAMNVVNTYLTSGAAQYTFVAGGSAYGVLSTAHFMMTGSTWANRPSSDVDISYEALELCVTHWHANQVNQRGQLLLTNPERLMIGISDEMLLRRILRSVNIPESANNDPNVVKDVFRDYKVAPLMTNDGRWLALGPKEETGFRYYEREMPSVERWADNSESGDPRWACLYREVHGYDHPENTWGSA